MKAVDAVDPIATIPLSTASASISSRGSRIPGTCPPLFDATDDFAAGFLVYAAIVLAVLALTSLIRPFDMATVDLAAADTG